MAQERLGLAVKVDDLIGPVHDNRRRAISLEQGALDRKRRRGARDRVRIRFRSARLPESAHRKARKLGEPMLGRPRAPENSPPLAHHLERLGNRIGGFARAEEQIRAII